MLQGKCWLLALTLGISCLSGGCLGQTAVRRQENAAHELRSGAAGKNQQGLEGWKRYEIAVGPRTISLVLPSTPEALTAASSDNTGVTRAFVSGATSSVYGVAYLENMTVAASEWERSGSDFFFEKFIRPFIGKMAPATPVTDESRFKMLESRNVRVSGVEWLEQDFAFGPTQGKALLTRFGEDGLCIVAIEKQPSHSVKSFFDSVKLTSAGS